MGKHVAWFVIVAAMACKKDRKGDTSMGSGEPQPAVPAEAAVSIDAAPAAASEITITKDGFSTLPNAKEQGDTDEVAKQLASKLPGFTVDFEVMDTPQGEEGYFSVKQGTTEVAQIVRSKMDDQLGVIVSGSMFPTPAGVRTGDKVSAVAAKYPDLACEADSDAELGLLQCTAGGLVFVLDAENYKGQKNGKLDVAKIGDLAVYQIATAP